jgi:hypothetical protein
MATSNVKEPWIKTGGNIVEWHYSTEHKYIEKEKIVRELGRWNTLLVNLHAAEFLNLVYYKLIQLPFFSFNTKRKKNTIHKTLRKVNKLKNCSNNINKIFNKNKIIKRTFPQDLIKKINLSKHFLLTAFQKSTLNEIVNSDKNKFILIVYSNIYIFDLTNIDLTKFMLKVGSASKLHGKLKFCIDFAVINHFIYIDVAKINIAVELLKLAFMRNSKKGQHRLFLHYIKVVQSEYKLNIKRNKFTKLDWKGKFKNDKIIICVNGKFSATGRTQSIKIQPYRIPLHTLLAICDYSEGFVNTKAGTFSIKIWRYFENKNT